MTGPASDAPDGGDGSPVSLHPGGGILQGSGHGYWFRGHFYGERDRLEDWQEILRAPAPLPIQRIVDDLGPRRLGPVLDRGPEPLARKAGALARTLLGETREALRRGRYHLARDLSNRLHQRADQTAESRHLEAVAWFGLGHYPESAGALHRALELGAVQHPVVLDATERDRLLVLLDDRLARQPDDGDGRLLAAWFEWVAGRLARAADHLQVLQQIAPGGPGLRWLEREVAASLESPRARPRRR